MNLPFDVPTERDFDAAGFGTNAVDYLLRTPNFPDFGDKMELESYSIEAGGEVASTMTGLQRLGFTTAYGGAFGGDPAGELGQASLIEAGVDVSYSTVVCDARTQAGFILIDGRTGERTVLWQRDERLAFGPGNAPVELAPRCRVLHMTPHDTAACVKMARAAREAGTLVSLDVDNNFDGIEELLPLADICISSQEFPEKLLGISDPELSLRTIKERYGCPVTGITLGTDGSIVLCGERLIATPAFAVPGGCVDTTGAGDAFRTGFLYGVLSGLSLAECCRTANAVAALKCRKTGARRALPNRSEVEKMLGK